MRPSKFVVTSAKMPLEDAIQITDTLVAQLPGLIAKVDEYHEESATGVFEPQRRTRIEILGLDTQQNPMAFWTSQLRQEFSDATWQWSQLTLQEENEMSVHQVRRRVVAEIQNSP